ncbi:MAG: hypothetical protein JEY91_05295 [Spirochaetaceae bacterium]|nr:hypothetical protein [Spirochaetaceae bacterium]
MKIVRIFAICTLFTMTFVNLSAEEEKEKRNWGFIFNTSSVLLDLESYQAGVGLKLLLNNDMALRFLLNGEYDSGTSFFSASLGTTFEKHFLRRRASPYWGAFASVGINGLTDETDEQNWTKNREVPIGVGAVLGIEFFIIESISIFAEYSLAFEAYINTTRSEVAGEPVDPVRDWGYSIDTGIGNESKLGIIIYLDDVIKIDRK